MFMGEPLPLNFNWLSIKRVILAIDLLSCCSLN